MSQRLIVKGGKIYAAGPRRVDLPYDYSRCANSECPMARDCARAFEFTGICTLIRGVPDCTLDGILSCEHHIPLEAKEKDT